MPKKNTSLNLRNPKQLDLIYTFAISEGRLSKDRIMEIGNKELFYRMKNNNFIKETQKGSNIFKATSKLQALTEKTAGISYGNGCSSKHSGKIGKALAYLPKEILSEGRFESGQMLKQEMSKFKAMPNPTYKNAITQLQKDVIQQERQIQSNFLSYISSSLSQAERYQALIDYKADMQICRMKKEVAFSDTPLFIPDFKVDASREETSQILQAMTDQQAQLSEGSKEYCFLEQNIKKLQHLLQVEQPCYNVYFEIVTDSYGRQELERHHNYEAVMQRDVLYIY